jgi:hypothetical protein
LRSNSSGFSNVAIGTNALYKNTDRSNLVAVGDSALYNNGVGATQSFHATNNTAVGSKALYSNLTGSGNTATGPNALFFNTTGLENTSMGNSALYYNNIGNNNTASGSSALYSNTTGNQNTANGAFALSANTTGFGNTGFGYSTGNSTLTNQYSTFLGYDADFTTGNFPDVYRSTALGYNARVTSDDQVCIGNTSTLSIGGFQSWTNHSDGRYKKQVQENVKGLDFIRRLRPVTYNLDVRGLSSHLGESTPEGGSVSRGVPKDQIRYTGFIAQEVEAAARQAGYDFSGVDVPQNADGLYGLRYAEFTVPLVKAVQEQQAMIERLQVENSALKAQLNTQAILLQQITAALQTAGIGVGN